MSTQRAAVYTEILIRNGTEWGQLDGSFTIWHTYLVQDELEGGWLDGARTNNDSFTVRLTPKTLEYLKNERISD